MVVVIRYSNNTELNFTSNIEENEFIKSLDKKIHFDYIDNIEESKVGH